MRGGVPVLSRPTGSASSRRRAARDRDGGSPARPAGIVLEADVDAPAQEGAGREHHGTGAEAQADGGDGAGDAVALEDQVVDRLLEEPEVGLVLQAAADGRTVEDAVGLRARGPHRRALARVEGAELDAGLVGGERHGPAQRVDLAHQVALADAADRRVAGHLPQRLDGVREQQRARAGAGRGQGGLGAGVAAADDDHVETGGKVHGSAGAAGPGPATRENREFYGKRPPDLALVPRGTGGSAVPGPEPGGGPGDGLLAGLRMGADRGAAPARAARIAHVGPLALAAVRGRSKAWWAPGYTSISTEPAGAPAASASQWRAGVQSSAAAGLDEEGNRRAEGRLRAGRRIPGRRPRRPGTAGRPPGARGHRP